MDIYRPSKGRRVPLPGSSQAWPASGLPVDLSNPYVARLVRDGDLEKVPEASGSGASTVVETSGQRRARKPAGDDA